MSRFQLNIKITVSELNFKFFNHRSEMDFDEEMIPVPDSIAPVTQASKSKSEGPPIWITMCKEII